MIETDWTDAEGRVIVEPEKDLVAEAAEKAAAAEAEAKAAEEAASAEAEAAAAEEAAAAAEAAGV